MVRLKDNNNNNSSKQFGISIPYGSIKRMLGCVHNVPTSLFQFLMVLLKVKIFTDKGDVVIFQFLMVRLKENRIQVGLHPLQFQFLMVRLKVQLL